MSPAAVDREPFAPISAAADYVPREATERALEGVLAALRSGARRIALTGAAGLGKTTLIRVLDQRLREDFDPLFAPYSALPTQELCALLLGLHGAVVSDDPQALLLEAAREAQARGKPLVFLLDDANGFTPQAARELTQVVDRAGGGLRCVLALLDDDRAGPLLQAFGPVVEEVRLSEPMSEAETAAYLKARLRNSGTEPELAERFGDAAVRLIHRESDGIPRVVNALADELLHHKDRARFAEVEEEATPADTPRSSPPPLSIVPPPAEAPPPAQVAPTAAKGPATSPALEASSADAAGVSREAARLERLARRPAPPAPAARTPEAPPALVTRTPEAPPALVTRTPEAPPAPFARTPETARPRRLDREREGVVGPLSGWAAEPERRSRGGLAWAALSIGIVAGLAAAFWGLPRIADELATETVELPPVAAPAPSATAPGPSVPGFDESLGESLPPAESLAGGAEWAEGETAVEEPAGIGDAPAGGFDEFSLAARETAPEPELPDVAAASPAEPPATTEPELAEPAVPTEPVVLAEPVRVHFNASPWATIRVDGELLGETPLANVPLAPGTHAVIATLPDGRSVEQEIEVAPDSRHFSFAAPAP